MSVCRGENDVIMWLLSQKDNVEVLKPKSLRDEIKKTLLQMLELYQ